MFQTTNQVGCYYIQTNLRGNTTMHHVIIITALPQGRDPSVIKHGNGQFPTMWGPRSIAKLVYNSNNYGLWYL